MKRSTHAREEDSRFRASHSSGSGKGGLAAIPSPPSLPRGGRFWLAFSGGCDSTVLLHALAHQRLQPLSVVHVNHGLQAAAAKWTAHCRAQCRQLKLPFRALKVAIDRTDPTGPEASARTARYAALRALMRPGDCLITAHHRDDQAETVLLRILRGTGVDGLAAMQPLTPFRPGVLWRPLLGVTRDQLQAHAQAAGLRWIDDPHNRDSRYARSRLRAEVMPLLERFAPGAGERIARLSEHAADSAELASEIAARDLDRLRDGDALSLTGLLELSAARRRNVLRAWLADESGLPPPAAALTRIEAEVLRARADAAPALTLGARELRRFRDRLFLAPALPPAPAPGATPWTGRRALRLPAGCGRIRLDGATSALDLTVDFARGGERLKPCSGRPTRTLKNLFQESGVPPWVRQRTPLIYENGALRCAGDAWCDQEWARRGLVLSWDVELPGRKRGESQR